ncbi:energy transducer TonB [Chryseobacterium sp. C-71]|uniref:energy transducer TonB n=1 Tax=Chryseobacterium sp. C-71 TaxID=2893882 RepID=UPI001E5D8AC2|nr:energy transducer TonB [Chryseobacterium sp. C-71]UFH30630.1 energy transducer TonB [Chryseobacterium sp. C-71]
MTKFLTLFSLIFFRFIFGQEAIDGTTELNELALIQKNGKIKIDAEKPAVFSLGNIEFQNLISKNFKVRKVVTNLETETCQIIFIVDKDGSMVEIKSFGTNESFNNEAIRAISKIKQKWIPAELNGEKIRYKFKVPLTISFK